MSTSELATTPVPRAGAATLLLPIIGSGAVRALSAGMSFGVALGLARLLGPAGYGTYAFLTSAMLLATSFGKWGWDKATVRFVSQYIAQGDYRALHQFLEARRRSVAWFAGAAAIACALWIALPPLSLGIPTAVIAACVVVATTAGLLLQATLRGAALTAFAEVPESVLKPITALAITSGVIAIVGPSDFVPIAGLLGASLLANALALKLHSLSPALERKSPGSSVARTHCWHREVAEYGVLGFAQVAASRLPVIIGAVFCDAQTIGHVAVAVRLSDLVGLGITSIGLTAAPRISGLFHSGALDECRLLVRRTTLYSLIAGLSISVLLLLFGRPILQLFGTEFVSAYPLLSVMCVVQAIAAVFGPVGYVATVSGHQRQAAWITLLAAAVGAALTVPLAIRYGGAGVVFALAGSVLLVSMLLAILSHRVLVKP